MAPTPPPAGDRSIRKQNPADFVRWLAQHGSTTSTPPRPCPSELDLPSVPSLDLGSKPEARSTTAEIEDWTRHVGVPVHVLAHGVPVSESEDSSDVVRVDQITDEHAAGHETSLHLAADVAYTCELFGPANAVAYWCKTNQ